MPGSTATRSEPPALDERDRAAALEKAAECRQVRADVKSQLKAGTIGLADVLDWADGDQFVAGIKALTLLESLPRVGKVGARRTMEEIGIAHSRRVRGLGANQRAALLERFPRDT